MKKSCSLLLILAALCGPPLAARATVIVDDTWASGLRTNWNLPAESPWYSWTSGTTAYIGTDVGDMYLTNTLGVTRLFWTYFTTNAPELTIPYLPTGTLPGSSNFNTISASSNCYYGYPLTVGIGQTIQATLAFTMADVQPTGPDYNNNKVVRFALLDYDTNSVLGATNGRVIRDTSQITKSGCGVTGYRMDVPFYQMMTNQALMGLRYRFAYSPVVDPIGDAAAWSATLGAGPTLTNWTGFLPNTPYVLTLAVQRYATSNVISGSIAGGSFTNTDNNVVSNYFAYSAIDTSGTNYHRFDNFCIRFDTQGTCTTLFSVQEFKLEVLPLTFPITVVDKINEDSLRLKWNTIANQKYQIQYKSDLNDPEWTVVETDLATTTTLTRTNTGLTGVGQRFYRIVNTQ